METGRDFGHGAAPVGQDAVTDQGIGATGEGSPASPPSDASAAAAGGAAAITAGGVAGLIGFVFVMHGVADLLSKVMPRWAANGLVGLAMAGTGAALGLSGKQKLSTANLTPTQTIQSLREDTDWAKEQLGSAAGV